MKQKKTSSQHVDYSTCAYSFGFVLQTAKNRKRILTFKFSEKLM